MLIKKCVSKNKQKNPIIADQFKTGKKMFYLIWQMFSYIYSYNVQCTFWKAVAVWSSGDLVSVKLF